MQRAQQRQVRAARCLHAKEGLPPETIRLEAKFRRFLSLAPCVTSTRTNRSRICSVGYSATSRIAGLAGRGGLSAVLRDIWVKRDPNSRRIQVDTVPRELDARQFELFETGNNGFRVFESFGRIRGSKFERCQLQKTK